MNSSTETLKKFVAQHSKVVKLPTIAETKRKIMTTKSFDTLRDYCHNANPKLKDIAEKRMETFLPKLLAKQKNLKKLLEWYENAQIDNDHIVRGYFLTRLSVMYPKNISRMFVLRKKIIDHTIFHDVALLENIEMHILKLVQRSPRKNNFKYLQSIWWKLSHSGKAIRELEKLMPNALLVYRDRTELFKLRDGMRSGWNNYNHGAYAAITARIDAVTYMKIPYERNIDQLTSFSRHITTDKTLRKLDGQLADVVWPILKNIHSVENVIKYFVTLRNDFDDRYRLLWETFSSRIDDLLPAVLQKCKNPQDVRPYLSLLAGTHFRSAYQQCLKRFRVLVPRSVKKEPNLAMFVAWEGYYPNTPWWRNTLEQLIANETNPEVLGNIDTSGVTNPLKPYEEDIKNRILALVKKLKEPSKFFLNCIQTNRFFGNEKLFIKKAQEFMGREK